jgi:hypothetical protein
MGIRKFRSVVEMPHPSPFPPLDPENLRLAFWLMGLTQWLSRRPPLVPGVRKFRSVEEMDAYRGARELEEARKLAGARGPQGDKRTK